MRTNKLPIVIIDDNEIDRERYRRYLEHASGDYKVHEAADQETGIALITTVQPACVLLDLRLSQESGFEVLDQLRKRFPLMPVIMLSGARQDVLKKGAESLGAKAYLTKDEITAEALHEAIRQALSP